MSLPGSNDAVNLDNLKKIMDNDLELIQDCFNDFIQEWPAHFVEIKGAILEKDTRTLENSAHKLKGSLKYLAAEGAADAAQVLEQAGRENNLQGIDEKLGTLKTQCQQLVEYIRQFTP